MRLIKQMTYTTVATIFLGSTVPFVVPTQQAGANILSAQNSFVPENIETSMTQISGAIDVQKLSGEALSQFEKSIEIAAQRMGLSKVDEASAIDVLRGFFDSKQAYYANTQLATEALISAIDRNHQNVLSGEQVLAARHGKISTRFLGAVLDIVISACVGGGVGAAAALVRRKGRAAAKRIVQQRVVNKMRGMGLGRAAGYASAALDLALGYYSPGSIIAHRIDASDRKRNNGWIELW